MTVKEFWHLKYETIVEDPCIIHGCSGDWNWGWKGKVVKREVIDECSGFLITKNETLDFKTSRKLLQITFYCGNGNYRYVDSSQDLSNLQIVKK